MCSELPPLFDAVLVPVEMLPKHALDIARDAGASQADPANNKVQPLLGLVGDVDRLAVTDAYGLEVRLSKCGQILLVTLGLSRGRSGWSGRDEFFLRLIRRRRIRYVSCQLGLCGRIKEGQLFHLRLRFHFRLTLCFGIAAYAAHRFQFGGQSSVP